MAQEQLEGTIEEQGSQQQDGSENGGHGHGGLKTAAAASVAAGVSYLVAKRALDQRGGSGSSRDEGDKDTKRESGGDGGTAGGATSRTSDSLRSAAELLSWDRAQDFVVPMAEKAAGAVGTYVARETPEIVSERLVPRFIDAFNKAKKGS